MGFWLFSVRLLGIGEKKTGTPSLVTVPMIRCALTCDLCAISVSYSDTTSLSLCSLQEEYEGAHVRYQEASQTVYVEVDAMPDEPTEVPVDITGYLFPRLRRELDPAQSRIILTLDVER